MNSTFKAKRKDYHLPSNSKILKDTFASSTLLMKIRGHKSISKNFEKNIIGNLSKRRCKSVLNTGKIKSTIMKFFKPVKNTHLVTPKRKTCNKQFTVKNKEVSKTYADKGKDIVRYVNKNVHRQLKEIATQQTFTTLKRIEHKYEQYVNSTQQIKNNIKPNNGFKASYIQVIKDKSINDFSLSVLRSDYRAEEVKRIKNMRARNLNNISTHFLFSLEKETARKVRRYFSRTINFIQ